MRPLVTLGVAPALGASLRAQDPALHLVKPCPQGTHTIKVRRSFRVLLRQRVRKPRFAGVLTWLVLARDF